MCLYITGNVVQTTYASASKIKLPGNLSKNYITFNKYLLENIEEIYIHESANLLYLRSLTIPSLRKASPVISIAKI